MGPRPGLGVTLYWAAERIIQKHIKQKVSNVKRHFILKNDHISPKCKRLTHVKRVVRIKVLETDNIFLNKIKIIFRVTFEVQNTP